MARSMNGPSISRNRVADGGPSRLTSRSNPSSSGRRPARRNTERTTASIRDHPSAGAGHGLLQNGDQLGPGLVDDRVEQGLLGGEVVEDRLFADPELAGQGVE